VCHSIGNQLTNHHIEESGTSTHLYTNYVMTSGSKTGKSTSLLATFYYFMFNLNHKITPTYVLNIVPKEISSQPLYKCANCNIAPIIELLNKNLLHKLKP
jgi:hypothetical protein